MVACGMGVCFPPEYAVTHPGVLLRRVVEPEIVREVCLATVRGRRWSPPLASFIDCVRRHRWPELAASRDHADDVLPVAV